jgi:hypothetical protein
VRLDHARTQEKLGDSEARNAFLVRLGDALHAKVHADDLELSAIRMLVEHMDVLLAHFAYYDDRFAHVHREYRRGGRSFVGRYLLRDWTFHLECWAAAARS